MGRKYKKRKSSKDERAEPSPPSLDRLSALPDAILIDILTLLPTKTAVSTSVLSNQWRDLWTHLTSLHLDFRKFPQHASQYYPIVDHLLTRLTSPSLRTFSLYAPFPTHQLLESWFRHLSDRNIQNINIDIDQSRTSTDSSSAASPFAMPHCIFRTQSLVCLNFPPFRLHYDLPVDTLVDIQLPNLKKLRLSLSASDSGFVSRLVRSCPLLEELSLSAAENWRRKPAKNDENGVVVIDISSANLKVLQLNSFAVSENVNVDVVIDAPNLDCFDLYASDLNCLFLKKPVALREATVITVISQSLVLALLPVTVLHIYAVTLFTFQYFKDNQGNSLVFRNLTELKLSTGADGLRAFPFESPPPSLLLRLKKVEVIMFNVKNGKNLKKLAEYLLHNTPALERLIFNVLPHSSQSEDKQKYMLDEMVVCMDLSSCSVISSKCVIEFRGKYAKLPANNDELQLMGSLVRLLRAHESLLDMVRSF